MELGISYPLSGPRFSLELKKTMDLSPGFPITDTHVLIAHTGHTHARIVHIAHTCTDVSHEYMQFACILCVHTSHMLLHIRHTCTHMHTHNFASNFQEAPAAPKPGGERLSNMKAPSSSKNSQAMRTNCRVSISFPPCPGSGISENPSRHSGPSSETGLWKNPCVLEGRPRARATGWIL